VILPLLELIANRILNWRAS